MEPNWAMSFLAVFSPHPGNAGDVVRRVAPKAEEVYDLLAAGHAEFLFHLIDTKDLVRLAHTAKTVDVDMLGDKLSEVLVGGDHDDLVKALAFGPVGGGADDIVGLVALAGDDGDVEGGDDAADIG